MPTLDEFIAQGGFEKHEESQKALDDYFANNSYNNDSSSDTTYDPFRTVQTGRDQFGDYRINAGGALTRDQTPFGTTLWNDPNPANRMAISQADKGILANFTPPSFPTPSANGVASAPTGNSTQYAYDTPSNGDSYLGGSSMPNAGGFTGMGNLGNIDHSQYNTAYAPQSQTPSVQIPQYNNLQQSITDQIMNQLNTQTQGITQELERAKQSQELAKTQNQQYLDEQLRRYGEEQAVAKQAAQDMQSRRGGFYSGGLDYQLGNQARTFDTARSDLTRDIAARNADLASRNSLLTEQAAARIEQLKTAAPAEIQRQLQDAIERQRQTAIQEAALTGMYNGMPTYQAQQAQQARTDAANKATADAKAAAAKAQAEAKTASDKAMFEYGKETGQVYAPGVLDAWQEMQDNAEAWWSANEADKQRLAERNKSLAAAYGIQQDEEGNWLPPQATPTLEAQNKQFDRVMKVAELDQKSAQWQAEFEEKARQWGVETAIDQAYKQGQLSIQQRNAALSAAREDRLAASAADTAKLNREKFDYEKSKPQQQKAGSYKNSPSFAEDVQFFISNPNERNLLVTGAQQFINEYGYDGYQELRKLVGLDEE